MRQDRYTCAFVALLLLPCGAEAKGKKRSELSVAGDVGFGGIGNVPFSTLQAGIDIREGGLSLGLRGRVRLAMQESLDGVVRKRDYDEVSDYLHILRYFRYQRRLGTVRFGFAAGELVGQSLGHGTLVRDYANIADPDHPHAGLRLDFQHDRFRLSAMLDNVLRPSIVAARIAARPFGGLPRLVFATTFVIDPRAPSEIRLGQDGRPEVDGAYNLAAEVETLGLLGFDLEYSFGAARGARLVPYVDLNTSFHGVGLHAGARGELPLSEGRLRLTARAEYRLASGGYAPAYAGTFHDVDRFQCTLGLTNAPDAPVTKLRSLREDRYGGHGVLAELGVDAGRPVSLRFGYRYHPGPDAHRLWLRAVSSPLRRLSLGALALLRGIDGAEGLAVIAEGRYQINSYLYALTQLSRSWALSEETRSFAPLLGFNIGVGGNWSG